MVYIYIISTDFRASGGGMVDTTPEIDAKVKNELERVQKSFGAVAGEDFTKFPVFNFQGWFNSWVEYKVWVKTKHVCCLTIWIQLPG